MTDRTILTPSALRARVAYYRQLAEEYRKRAASPQTYGGMMTGTFFTLTASSTGPMTYTEKARDADLYAQSAENELTMRLFLGEVE